MGSISNVETNVTKPSKKDRNGSAVTRAKRAARSKAVQIELPAWSAPSHRRDKCRDSLAAFIIEYLPHRFPIAMSRDHCTAIQRMECAVKEGGQFAQAAPRGDGKTERTIACVLWATLYGWRRFVPVVAADLTGAKSIVGEIFAELADNDKLAEDWPHICLPMTEVQAAPNRARFIQFEGKPVHMEAKTGGLVYPQPHNSKDPACGAVVIARGITSAIRGLRRKSPRGGSMRPDFLIVDDPQTDESAHSPEQCKTRENLIAGTLLGLAGPNKKIAAIANMTIIRPGDLAHRLIDNQQHPEWRGVRFALMYEWPTARETLWKQYADIRREGQRNGDNGESCNAFYAANRAEMDAGAVVGWEHRKREGELSAIQCAFNILIDNGEETFFSEYQNDPKQSVAVGWEILEQDVAGHLSNVPRGKVPNECEVFTVGADVNLYGINWIAVGWTTEGAGYVFDYGRYPGNDRPIWDAKTSTISEDAAIFSAISSLSVEIASRPYSKLNGEQVKISACVFDCGYKREAVMRACAPARRAMNPAQVLPVRALSTKHYRPSAMNRKGDGWHTSKLGESFALMINADVWRERMQKGFLVPVGCPGGSIALYGADQRAHLALADHVCSEKISDVLTGEKMGLVYAWYVLPGKRNDLADALTYACAAAGFSGVQFSPSKTGSKQPGKGVGNTAPAQSADSKPIHRQHIPHRAPRPARRGGFVSAW